MHVIGTAGHVDHGKSTLVKTLTGIDPDRLQVEKEREMSIVLGFAWLTLPNGEQVGIIDVPGHRDFIKNMLAGVGGIDAALLVIAADEGIMPQTREHLAILDLLQIQGGVIALTKIDLVDDPEWLDLVMADVMEQVDGTCLQDAPIVPVSSVTGAGLDELVAELARCLRAVPARANRGRPRLPVDRVFTIAGFGTVVTGTLIGGVLSVGQEVELVPSGLRARIRGLQTHKEKIEQAMPGSRVAVNLSGISKDEIVRGQVVTLPGLLQSTQLVDVQLRYLPGISQPLKHNTEVDFFCGASEVPARVRLLGSEKLDPGEAGWAQLQLSLPVALVRGERFILRWLSPSITVGGGIVVDPLPGRRHRRFKADVIARLETLLSGTPEDIVLQILEHEQPVEVRVLYKTVSLPIEVIDEALRALLAGGQVFFLDDFVRPIVDRWALSASFLISSFGWQQFVAQMRAILGAYHAAWPLRKGMPREELRSRLQEGRSALSGKLFNQIADRAVHESVIGADETGVWLADHRVQFDAGQQRRADALVEAFRRAPFATPSADECEAQLGGELFNALLEQGVLVRASADVVFLGATFVWARERVVAHVEREGSITVAQVRDLFDTSRKYALALMEYLDERRVTKRQGDVRVLR
ncbi:MAG: selenocysteine-specific translation elongation factor [Anaerolineae bacterium]|nr:selenocysteine-specific translation elongation factor [Anaerolineae bacterium]